MKNILLASIAALISLAASAQSSTKVKWSYSAKKIGNVYEIRLQATIDNGWHIFSQHPYGGIPPTKIIFDRNDSITLVDAKPKEIGKLIIKDVRYQGTLRYFEKTVAFVQKVRLKGSSSIVSGKIRFGVASSTEGMAPSEISFSVGIGK